MNGLGIIKKVFLILYYTFTLLIINKLNNFLFLINSSTFIICTRNESLKRLK